MVAVCTRKEYLTMSLPEVSFADSAWVSLSPRMAPPGGGRGWRRHQGPAYSLMPWLLF